jgi:hypothetical protein
MIFPVPPESLRDKPPVRRQAVLSPCMVTMDLFRQGLLAQMARATYQGRIDVLINSGELYRSLGGDPGSTHGMPFCCDAMEAEMKLGDVVLIERANGAGMTVRYLLPRST